MLGDEVLVIGSIGRAVFPHWATQAFANVILTLSGTLIMLV